MKPVDAAEIVTDYGVDGDRKAKAGSKRQVLVMPAEVLDKLELTPGTVRENITTRGFDVMALPRGARVRIGGALLEATVECAPCGLMDDIRPGLQTNCAVSAGCCSACWKAARCRLATRSSRWATANSGWHMAGGEWHIARSLRSLNGG